MAALEHVKVCNGRPCNKFLASHSIMSMLAPLLMHENKGCLFCCRRFTAAHACSIAVCSRICLQKLQDHPVIASTGSLAWVQYQGKARSL